MSVKGRSTGLYARCTVRGSARLKRIVKKQEAKDLGLTRYFDGTKCINGHVSERQTSSGKCCECRIKPKIDKVIKCADPALIINRSDAVSLGMTKYFDGCKCKNGHIDYRYISNGTCVSCYRETSRNFNMTPKRIAYLEVYKIKNKDKIRRRQRKYYYDNIEKCKETTLRIYHEKKSRPEQKAIQFIRNSLRRLVYSSGQRSCSTGFKLNYTRDELVKHMESLFKEGMCWENHGEWHIDHIIPVSYFVKQGVTDPNIVNALSNLRPLWASENKKKGKRMAHE